ncbi:hypothetical protein FO519_002407 [Halicephalobus sp. NKZ332]|nr:hypothetical protein FO519_002407 [Halicephalobus sp. NKZ332]
MDYLTSEAPPTTADEVQVWTIVIVCIVFCFAVRHMNDFFSGDTITLVEEGTWGGRFKHRHEYRIIQQIEKDFAKMYYEITKADEHRDSIRRERMKRDEEMYEKHYEIDTDGSD